MWIVGGDIGGGTLQFQGDSYKFKTDGLKLGGFGVHQVKMNGDVYNLENAADFAGVYGAAEAGVTLGKWSLALDTIYWDISQNEAGSETIPVLGANRHVNTNIDMKASITTFGGGYNLVDNERVKLDFIVAGGTSGSMLM